MRETYELSGTGAIPLRRRDGSVSAYTYVYLDDFKRLSAERWYLREGYAVRSGRRLPSKRSQRQIRLHREVLGLAEGDGVKTDHIDHDTLNNRRSNLRACTHAENHQNRRASGDRGSSSRYRGVSWRKDVERWQAYGVWRGKQEHLGFFDSEQEAADAAAAWRERHMPFSTN